nr:hypothetical protein [Tanacetum cinerariifolium]
MKTEALAEQVKAAKPVRALTVYPPNTPVKLVPKETRSEADRTLDFRALDFQITQLTEKVLVLQEQNELFRVENAKVKQHYKELYDSIKITHSVTPKVLAPGMYAIDVEPITPRCRNNREVHLEYLKHLKESVATIREIVKEARVERPLDSSLASACLYTKCSQELVEYAVGSCPKDFNKRDKKQATTPLTRKKQVTFVDQWDRSRLMNFVKKFIGTIKFGNDHFGAIMGYEDYVIGESLLSRVYYVEGLGHNLFSNRLSKRLTKVEVEKYHLYSSCQLGKSKKYIYKPKAENTIMEVLYTLHIDLCGPMQVQSINGKKYILVIVDDYSRFTWVKFLRSKDETLDFVIKFLTQIQVGLNEAVRFMLPRTPQQNDVVKRRNRTLVEATRTMLIFSKAPMFLWAEAVATACYTQNRSLIHTRHNKTPYELVHDKKSDLTLCYPTNDNEDLGKLQPTADVGIFVGYAPSRKRYRIYNKRRRRIMETNHIQFDELSEPMDPMQLSTRPVPTFLTSGLVQNSVSPTPYVPPSKKNFEILFQPLFDEYFNPPPRVVSLVSTAVAAPRAVDPIDSPSSTTIDQDVPSASTSPTIQEIKSQVTHQGAEGHMHGHQNA